MAEPFSYAAAGASVLSAGMSLFGSKQQSDRGEMQMAMANRNAEIARRNAAVARDRAASDVGDIAIETRKALGSIRAAAGAAGLVTNEGSPLEALMESASNGELNAQRRKWRGEVEAQDFENQANAELQRGLLVQQSSDAQALGSLGSAGASLLTGASRVYNIINPGSGKT